MIENKIIIEGDTEPKQITLSGNIKLTALNIGGAITMGAMAETYDGDYIVTPKRTQQELETKNKLMTEDVIVKEVPYLETSNEYGTTVSIAS